DDGVTMTVPIAALNQVDATRCEWLVPGMLKDKVQALLKSLPQKHRRHLVPLPDSAEAFVARRKGEVASGKAAKPLVDALIDDLREQHALRVQREDFRPETLPPHLYMNFRLVDAHGAYIAASRSLPQLKADHGARAQTAFQAALAEIGERLKVPQGARRADAPARRTGASETNGAAAIGRAANDVVANGAPVVAGPSDASEPGSGDPGFVPGQRFTDWSFGKLPELLEIEQRSGGKRQTLIGF